MQDDEREEINRFCLAVIQETDPVKLTERVKELNDLLERREREREGKERKAPQSAPAIAEREAGWRSRQREF